LTAALDAGPSTEQARPVRIGVLGVGGAGGYFGGRLAQSGEDVVFIARGATLEALRRDGLHLESPKGDADLTGLTVAGSPEEAGELDAVILGVKSWQVVEAARSLSPAMRPESFVVPLQNGVDAPDQIAAALSPSHAVGGLARIIAFQIGPARIRHLGAEPFLAFGELDAPTSPRTERLRDALARAGVACEVSPDIRRAMWEKLLLVVPLGGVGAATRRRFGELFGSANSRALLREAMGEVVAVARARGIGLSDEDAEKALAFLEKLPSDGTSSLQRDLEAGRPSEIEAWTGAVVRLARESGIPAPRHEALYRELKPRDEAARAAARGAQG
jgi:2-dehydropantoate 2-reductase